MSLRNTMRRLVAAQTEDEDEDAAATAAEADAAEDDDEEDEQASAAAEDDEEDEDGMAEDDDEEEESASASAARPSRTRQAFALIRSPEAKGREKLATALAEDVAEGRLTAKRAKALLACAPKASRLADAMAGKDVNPGPSGGGGQGNGKLSAADQQLVNFATQMAKARRGKRG